MPEWCNEPERFLDVPWVIPANPAAARDSVLYAPGAFIRHGALADPADLDARGGETREWIPGRPQWVIPEDRPSEGRA